MISVCSECGALYSADVESDGLCGYCRRAIDRALPPGAPQTGPELAAYAASNRIDPDLASWIAKTLQPLGLPADLAAWSRRQIAECWPLIRRRLERQKAADEQTGPAHGAPAWPSGNGHSH